MTFEEVFNELKEMRSRFDSGFSSLDRQRIGELYWRICGKHITNINCPDCYKDAFLETYAFLQRTGKLPDEKHYILKEGRCLHIFGSSDYLFDVTDEQAETFLAQNPNAIEHFKTFPTDWQERVEKRKGKRSRKKANDKTKSK